MVEVIGRRGRAASCCDKTVFYAQGGGQLRRSPASWSSPDGSAVAIGPTGRL